ncbi:MAG: response regulator [Bacteroidetes bacterium]|jgi:CheY-like chemotaxis protein|nr:response regulator [Bacteroidota bacterium]MBT6686191.1 response regulator [Bacteroidota bacterium]MBT7143902.1 response regulator [Bacteroidota bacterium]MBT7491257.1 response regulator [Bacteroidota bacterium]
MKKNILVIDDDFAIRQSFILTFEDTNYNVVVAESGYEGIDKFKMQKFDLVYLDLKMPGMNGVETLNELRKIDSETSIYIFTAYHKEFFEQLKKAAEAGLDFEVLHKPLDSAQLKEITESLIE